VFLAVVWSNLEWHWVENDDKYVIALFGVAAAFVSTLAVSWIIERAKTLTGHSPAQVQTGDQFAERIADKGNAAD
jgi:hypothetical protein